MNKSKKCFVEIKPKKISPDEMKEHLAHISEIADRIAPCFVLEDGHTGLMHTMIRMTCDIKEGGLA